MDRDNLITGVITGVFLATICWCLWLAKYDCTKYSFEGDIGSRKEVCIQYTRIGYGQE